MELICCWIACDGVMGQLWRDVCVRGERLDHLWE